MSVLQNVRKLLQIAASDVAPVTTVVSAPPLTCTPADLVGQKVVRNEDYFSVTLNEMYLTKGRKFWSTFDPLVFLSVDFVHGKEVISVPSLIGPSALKGKQELPHGFLVNDIRVAGPHPFRGGTVALTVVLYQTKTHDYAKKLLQFAEGITGAIGVPAGVELVTKVGSTLLGAFETLIEMGDCVPITGHRIEINGSSMRGLTSAYTAVISGKEDPTDLSINDSRLLKGGQPYRDKDFLLYNISRQEFREQESTLPFYDMVDEINNAALSTEEESWNRAKALLIAVYQKMLACPDLTAKEADKLFEEYKAAMVHERGRAVKVGLMDTDQRNTKTEAARKLDRVVRDLTITDTV
jgi:hypothetical protein